MEGFVFYRSFRDAIESLPDDQKLKAYQAIINYGIDGDENIEPGIVAAIFMMAKPQIDANAKRKAAGLKGGRPKKTDGYEIKKPMVSENKNQRLQDEKPKEKEKVKVKEKELYGTLKNVSLAENEYQKLVDEYGQSKADKAVEFLGSYIAEKGYKSKSHYLSIRRWVIDAVSKPTARSGTNKFIEFSGRQDYNMTELEKMLEGN